MTVEQRLELLMSNEGINQKQIAEAVSVSGQTITNWKIRNSIGKASARTLSDLYGYSLEWLLTGNGPMRADGQQQAAPAVAKPSNVYRVDVLDVQASAGPGTMLSADFVETIRAIEYTPEKGRALFDSIPSESVKVITVRGDSMEGTIDPGDEIFVNVSVRGFDGDGIYVFVFGNTMHVKRLQMHKDRILVISDNAKYKEWYIEDGELDKFHIMAKVLIKQTIAYKRFG